MRAQLERMVGTEGISSGLYELVSNALARRDST
jgi:hypothetical protein